MLSAVDVANGTIRWQRKVPGQLMFGGAVATAGDLVFLGRSHGLIEALDAGSGKLLWQFRVGRGPLGPPIAFQVDGQQRIAVTTREGLTVFGLRVTGRGATSWRPLHDEELLSRTSPWFPILRCIIASACIRPRLA